MHPSSRHIRLKSAVRKYRGVGALAMAFLVALGLLAEPAVAAGSCSTSGPAQYQVTICFTSPSSGASLTGATTLAATVTVSGTNPGIQRVVFYLDAQYLLTDYSAPYSFALPSDQFVDGTRTLQVEALMRDAFTTSRAQVGVSFSNGVLTPPVNGNSFTPTSGRTPGPGQPFVLAAAGDGASGETNASNVSSLIASWNPNLFLYLGDVYEQGSISEFDNWYGSSGTNFARLKAVTDPTVGNHEYQGGVAPGYFNYWDNPAHYYSFDAGGWHFITLDSTSQFNQFTPASAQYQWLQADLASHPNACTMAYFHHPVYSVGPQGNTTAMNQIWSLLATNGVDVVLTGHDHSYQRWTAMDANGNSAPGGINEFVVGTGGHGIQKFARTDPRMLAGFDTTPSAYGAFRMVLNSTGASYQFINTSGTALDSGSVSCGGSDSVPPTAPSQLSAVATSSHNVDLTWAPSTDNMAVTAYQIVRDGAVVGTVGPSTAYSDSTVQANTSYRYTVRAMDGAGNLSGSSNVALVTTPVGTPSMFSDGFESGNLGAWTLVNGLTVQSLTVHGGSFAARANSTGLPAEARRQLAQPVPDAYYRIWFRLASQGNNNVYLMKFRSASDQSLIGVYLTPTGRLAYRNDVAALSSTSSTVVSAATWHELQVRVLTGASGRVETWLDGFPVAALTKNEPVGPTPVGRLQLGDNSSGRTFDVAFDDVEASTQFITTTTGPDVTPPTAPSFLTASAATFNRVDLGWIGSTDDVGVTGYQISRDGVVIDTVGPQTAYTDTPVLPSTTYQYTVRAMDAAGHFSVPSNVASVTTPALSASLFSDGFESGTLSSWTTVAGMVDQQQQVRTGAWAARATSSGGGAAQLIETLAQTTNDLYYRTWFKVVSQGNNNVYLLKFRSATNVSMVGVYLSTNGTLAYRNDVAGLTTSTSAAVTPGVWHELEVHLTAGASGRVEIWLDDLTTPVLSKTESLGASPIGRLQLGENTTTRTFDIAFDDVEMSLSKLS